MIETLYNRNNYVETQKVLLDKINAKSLSYDDVINSLRIFSDL